VNASVDDTCSVVSFWKETAKRKYLSATVQSLEQYAAQSFNNNGLVVSVHVRTGLQSMETAGGVMEFRDK